MFIGEVGEWWKETFKLVYHKFIQDNVYQILSEPRGFCGRYDKNMLVCFFGSQCSFKPNVNLNDQKLVLVQVQLRLALKPKFETNVYK